MRNFSDLSESEKSEVIERYYSGDRVKKIISEFDLNCYPQDLYRCFPPETLGERCVYCDINLLRKRGSRTYSAGNHAYCETCGHVDVDDCSCANCCHLREQLRIRRLQSIQYRFGRERQKIRIDELGLREHVYLGSLVNLLYDANSDDLDKYSNAPLKLTPANLHTSEVYNHLMNNGIISVSPLSDIGAFCYSDSRSEYPERFSVNQVRYIINLSLNERATDIISYYTKPDWFDESMVDEALDMWRMIAADECIEYLNYGLTKFGLIPNISEEARKVFLNLLECFSISQIQYIIWRSDKQIAKDIMERKITKTIASSCIVNECLRYGKLVQIKNWSLSQFTRNTYLPQSAISAYFFDSVLKIGDRGFFEAPSKMILENLFILAPDKSEAEDIAEPSTNVNNCKTLFRNFSGQKNRDK